MKLLLVLLLMLSVVTVGISQAEVEEEEEELVYFDLNENPEVIKQKVSDAFWENPVNTPPMLVLITIVPVIVFIAWKRKWHVHQKTSDMRHGE